MPTQQKIDRVEDITDRLKRSSIAMTTRYSGISVNEMTELRRAMRNGGVDFTIVKNTLLALAAEGAEKPQLKEIIDGPTAIAFGYDDPVDAAKVIADYIRTGRSSLAIMGAVMGDGAPMSADEVTRLASLPPRAQLLASLLGLMQSPIAQLLTIMNGPVQALDNVLQARVRQMEEESPAPEAPVEAVAEPEATAEADEAPAAEASTDDEPETDADDAPAAEASTDDEPEAEPDEAPAAEASTDDETAAEVDEAPAAEASTDDGAEAESDEASEPEADAGDATADEPEAEEEGESA